MATALQPPARLLPASFPFSIAVNRSQTDNEGVGFFVVLVFVFFFCCFNCAVRILLVISVCRSR